MQIKYVMDINELINSGKTEDVITTLKNKKIVLPQWVSLRKEYYPEEHDIVTNPFYKDKVTRNVVDRVTRITYDLQRLSVNRMKELCYGVPVVRVYHTDEKDEKQEEVAKYLEKIFKVARIDSVNIERANKLFASCEVLTIWYAVEKQNKLYGFDSNIKLRCNTYSPMDNAQIFPLYDENEDMVALSVQYDVTDTKGNKITYFDVYTDEMHVKYECTDDWREIAREKITLGKIPAIYCYRKTPIWENTTRIVDEMEWAMSRNGNYLRKNSKPIFAVFGEKPAVGKAPDEKTTFKDVLQFNSGEDARYITWDGATENLKFYINELRQLFFTELQLPDWSYESMKSTPMSGEARKQLFIDAQLKVKDEAGRLLEMHEREVNVVKAFLKTMLPKSYENAIDSLIVEIVLTPFTITDESDTIKNLITANGGKPIISQLSAIKQLGWANDAIAEQEQIINESKLESDDLTM